MALLLNRYGNTSQNSAWNSVAAQYNAVQKPVTSWALASLEIRPFAFITLAYFGRYVGICDTGKYTVILLA